MKKLLHHVAIAWPNLARASQELHENSIDSFQCLPIYILMIFSIKVFKKSILKSAAYFSRIQVVRTVVFSFDSSSFLVSAARGILQETPVISYSTTSLHAFLAQCFGNSGCCAMR